jgi:DnaK suppressor protein
VLRERKSIDQYQGHFDASDSSFRQRKGKPADMAQFALTTGQIADLKQLLEERERMLQATLNAELHVEDPSQTSITAGSDADWTTADVDADTLIANAERHSKALTDTIAALEKVADGRYGVCESCGEAIGYPRLLANPSARRCLVCQQAEEARSG